MDTQSDAPTDVGIGGRLNWLTSGALGGVVGAAVFGGVLWLVEPELVTDVIPAIYGLDTGGRIGWLFHLAHGLVLGIIFAFIITRELFLGILTADVETPFLAAMGLGTRIILAGLVYGLAIWVFLPGVITAVLLSMGVFDDPFPAAASHSLAGHLLYGMFLGALVSLFIDVETEAQESDAPFEEATNGPAEP